MASPSENTPYQDLDTYSGLDVPATPETSWLKPSIGASMYGPLPTIPRTLIEPDLRCHCPHEHFDKMNKNTIRKQKHTIEDQNNEIKRLAFELAKAQLETSKKHASRFLKDENQKLMEHVKHFESIIKELDTQLSDMIAQNEELKTQSHRMAARIDELTPK